MDVEDPDEAPTRDDLLLAAFRLAVVHAGTPEESTPRSSWARDTAAAIASDEQGLLPFFDNYLNSLQTPGDYLWPSLIRTWVEEPVPGRPLLEVLLCTEWPVEEESPLWSGVAQRRLDVILDVLQTPASAADIQHLYTEFLTDLAGDAADQSPSVSVMGEVLAGSAVVHQLAIAEEDEDSVIDVRQWMVQEYLSVLDEMRFPVAGG